MRSGGGTVTPSDGSSNRAPTASFRARIVRAIALFVLGVAVTVGSAASDAYLHRGALDGSDVVFRQPVGPALATNVDLRGLSDNALQSELGILTEAGYRFVRQTVIWSDIERAPGEYDWSAYLPIFNAVDAAGLTPVVVLSGTPFWARYPDQLDYADAPPIDAATFQEFCGALRETFPDITIFQIGVNLDDPNYWGGRVLTAATYARMLQAASLGLGVAATDSLLIGGEIGADAASRASGRDLETIRRLMVNPNIRGLLKAVAVTVDGGDRSPYDRSVRSDRDNLSRVVLVREALDDVGAIDFPVWFTQFGWTGSGTSIDADRQAEFVVTGMRRIRNEWPWAGLVFNWDYGNRTDLPADANLQLVVNGQPTPLMAAMTTYGKSVFGSSITNGFVPPSTDSCTYQGNWQDQHLAEGVYRVSTDPNATVTCQFWGTGFSTFFRFSPEAGTVRYVIDQASLPLVGQGEGVANVFLTYQVEDAFEGPVQLASGLSEGAHIITMGQADADEVVIGGFLVDRERPMIWPIAVLVAAGLVAIFLGLRTFAYLAAEFVGLMDTRPPHPAQTALPTLTGWNPGPRFRR